MASTGVGTVVYDSSAVGATDNGADQTNTANEVRLGLKKITIAFYPGVGDTLTIEGKLRSEDAWITIATASSKTITTIDVLPYWRVHRSAGTSATSLVVAC